MKHELAKLLRCPRCHGALVPDPAALACASCAAVYPIEQAVPRFVPPDNYAGSFGYQWNLHARTQLDDATTRTSESRFFAATGWDRDLRGQRLLEAGSGAGRFTAVAAATGAEVYTFDYSSAVDANRRNHGSLPNVQFLQADIYAIPFAPASFDKVVCLGVLQHCPDPHRAFRSLVSQLTPGGQLAIDVYSLRPRAIVHPKYWLRPLTTRLPRERLYRTIERVVPALLPVKHRLATHALGKYLAYFVPIAYQPTWHAELSDSRVVEQSILDTFDWYSPTYDRPQTLARVRRWFREAGLLDVHVEYGANGVVGRGRRPTR